MLRAVHCFKFGVTMSRRSPWSSTQRYVLQPATSAIVDGWTRRTWAEGASCDERARKATAYDDPCSRGAAAAAADTYESDDRYGPFGPVVDKIYTKRMRELIHAYTTFDLRKEIGGIPEVALWAAGTAVAPMALIVANAFVTMSCAGYSENVMRYVLACATVANGWLLVNSGVASRPHASFWRFEAAIAPVTVPVLVAFVAPHPVAYVYVWWAALHVCSKLAAPDCALLQGSPPPPWVRPLVVLVFGAVTTSMLLATSCVIFA